jgi:Mannosyltransferase (PIG-V)
MSTETLERLGPLRLEPAPPLPAAERTRLGGIRGLRVGVGAALTTGLLVWAAALATIAIFGEDTAVRHAVDPAGLTPALHSGLLNTLLSPAARWDSVWYLQIAAHGYFSPASANFFPLYPLLLGILTPLFGNAIVAGLALSAACIVAALTLLYRLALLDLSEPAARMTVLLVAVFPTSMFLTAVYPTSLFLLLTVATLYAARREQWALAGLCGALAAATRSNGILLVAPLGMIYLYGPRDRSPLPNCSWWRPRYAIKREIAWLALVPAGLAAYLGYLLIAHDAPLAPFHAAHQVWDHSFGPPLGSVIDGVGAVPGDVSSLFHASATPLGAAAPVSWHVRNLIDLGFLVLAVAAVAVGWNRIPRTYVLFAVIQLVQITSFPIAAEPMMGFTRYLLGMVPLFLGAGAYLAERRTAARATLFVSAALLVVFSGLWAYWSLVP